MSDYKDVRIYCLTQSYLEVDLYRTRVKVIFTDDYEKSRKDFNVKYDADASLTGGTESAHMFYIYSKSMHYPPHIFLDKDILLNSPIDKLIIELAHEVLHVTNFILWHKGIAIDLDNDEPQAYLHTYLCEQLIEAVKQFVKKYKKKKR